MPKLIQYLTQATPAVLVLELYLFGLDLAVAEVAAAARVDVARVEYIGAAMLALQRLKDAYKRLPHLFKCGCCSPTQ